jgi:hypothetical protein
MCFLRSAWGFGWLDPRRNLSATTPLATSSTAGMSPPRLKLLAVETMRSTKLFWLLGAMSKFKKCNFISISSMDEASGVFIIEFVF